jgi:hypothetical protein
MGNDPCQGGALMFQLKQYRTWTEKKAFLEEAVQACAPKQKKCPSGSKAKKEKRKEGEPMRGWACAMRKCALDNNGLSMKLCTQSAEHKQDYQNNKESWNQKGQAGCL